MRGVCHGAHAIFAVFGVPEKPADSEPAAKEASVAEEPVEIDENFGMPEGGFKQFDEAAPAENPEETAAPAEAVPAEGTPAA